MPLFPQERIRLARQIEKAEYRNFQACLHNSWIEQAAAALEIELEEDMYKGAPRLVGWGLPPALYFPSLARGWNHRCFCDPSETAVGPFLVSCLLIPGGPALDLSYVSDSVSYDSPRSLRPGADTAGCPS